MHRFSRLLVYRHCLLEHTFFPPGLLLCHMLTLILQCHLAGPVWSYWTFSNVLILFASTRAVGVKVCPNMVRNKDNHPVGILLFFYLYLDVPGKVFSLHLWVIFLRYIILINLILVALILLLASDHPTIVFFSSITCVKKCSTWGLLPKEAVLYLGCFPSRQVQNDSLFLGICSFRRLFIDEGKDLGYLEEALVNQIRRPSVVCSVELHIHKLYAKDFDLQK